MISRSTNHAEALALLKSMVAADSHPVLTEPEVLRLLMASRRQDSAKVVPGGEGWLPTYDLDAAAAEGWRQKAGKAAGDYDFEADDSSLKRSQVVAQCNKMAEQYNKLIAPVATKVANRKMSPSEEFEALIWDEEMEI